MWSTLTLQRPKLKEKQVKSNLTHEKFKLRRAKTFCDNISANDNGAGPVNDSKTNQRTWLKNIRNWRKKFMMKNELNFTDDGFSKSCSASRDSLDKISCGPGLSEKVSRRAILDRSLNYNSINGCLEDEDDIWYNTNKLFQDHINEIHGKWDSIEDDIWGKVIVMERNRRVAKAYIRSPVVSVGGGREGFDGLRVGLQGFENPFRDNETRQVMSRLGGQCCRIQMDSEGFVDVRRTGKTEVNVMSALAATSHTTRLGTMGRRKPVEGPQVLEADQALLMFDMAKLKRNVADSFMYHGTGNRNKRELELECVTTLSFVKNNESILEQPCWIILINLVSLDFLRTSLSQQPVFTLRGCPAPGDLKSRPRLSLPYEQNTSQTNPRERPSTSTINRNKGSRDKKAGGGGGGDSLYYCGIQARISQFVLSEANRNRKKIQESISRYTKKSDDTEDDSDTDDTEYSRIEPENIYSTGQRYDVKWR